MLLLCYSSTDIFFDCLPRIFFFFCVPFLCAYKRQEMWQNKYSWNRNTKLEYLMYTKLFPYTKYVLHTYINSLQGVITMKYFLCNTNEWSEFLEFYGIGVSKFAWIDLVIKKWRFQTFFSFFNESEELKLYYRNKTFAFRQCSLKNLPI